MLSHIAVWCIVIIIQTVFKFQPLSYTHYAIFILLFLLSSFIIIYVNKSYLALQLYVDWLAELQLGRWRIALGCWISFPRVLFILSAHWFIITADQQPPDHKQRLFKLLLAHLKPLLLSFPFLFSIVILTFNQSWQRIFRASTPLHHKNTSCLL